MDIKNEESSDQINHILTRTTALLCFIGIMTTLSGLLGIFITFNDPVFAIGVTLLGLSMYWSSTMRYEIQKWYVRGNLQLFRRTVLDLKLATVGMFSFVCGMSLFYFTKSCPIFIWSLLDLTGIILITITIIRQLLRREE